jgi:hypothetical protein
MLEAQHGRVRDIGELTLKRRVQIRIIVPVDVGPDRRRAVEVRATLRICEPTAASRSDREWRQTEVLLHLGKRMPDMSMIFRVCFLIHHNHPLPPLARYQRYVTPAESWRRDAGTAGTS